MVKTMFVNKLKNATSPLLVAALVFGAGALGHRHMHRSIAAQPVAEKQLEKLHARDEAKPPGADPAKQQAKEAKPLDLPAIIKGVEAAEKAWRAQKSWMVRYKHTREVINPPVPVSGNEYEAPPREMTNARKGGWLLCHELTRPLNKPREDPEPGLRSHFWRLWKQGSFWYRLPYHKPIEDPKAVGIMYSTAWYPATLFMPIWEDALPPLKDLKPEHADHHEQNNLPRLLKEKAAHYEVRPQLQPIDGYPCHVVERTGKDVLWIDAARGFIVRRRNVYQPSGALLYEMKASGFRKKAPGIWLPENQTMLAYFLDSAQKELRGKVARIVTNTLLEARFNDLEDSFFAIPETDEPLKQRGGQGEAGRGDQPEKSQVRRIAGAEAADLEERIEKLYARIAPSVVRFPGKQGRGSGFSGVIVSRSGEILTCAHHHLPPQSKVTVELADGRHVPATILGSVKQEAVSKLRYSAADIGMARLDGEGDWPAAELRPPGDLKTGERCLALGYPNVHKPGQPPLLRLGRLLPPDSFGRIRSSCRAQPGDSGGPLVDGEGRVIGVLVAMDSLKTGVTFHSSVEAFFTLREKLRAGESSAFEKDVPEAFEWRKEKTGWALRPKQAGSLPARQEPWSELWGWQADETFARELTAARRSTVEVLRADQVVALGVVVAEQGWILTKRSELMGPSGPQPLVCRFADGARLDARVAAQSCAHDLVLLKVPASGLPTLRWASSESPRVGRLVASLGPGLEPLHYAIVAGLRVRNPGTPGELALRVEAAGEGAKGVRFIDWSQNRLDLEEVRNLLRPGDRITRLNGVVIASPEDLARHLSAAPLALAGERVLLTGERDGKSFKLHVPLVGGPAPILIPWRDARWNLRRDGFPVVFCHDGGIAHDRCGGPVVDRTGQVIGLNIARADPMQSFAIPSDVAQQVLAKLMKQARGG
ncbi:MAG: trypsin-like peptidase domain-containing protein [Beijerinckiaceae bacterium]|nr:trypsin-like peptidase domain-containing protein [Beijerinckiaceae bacterium]